jgi:hypothetical protein
VHEAQKIIGKAIEIYWKLKAIDSFQMSSPSPRLLAEEYTKIFDTLLEGNDELIEILIRNSTNIDVGQRQRTTDRSELIVTGLKTRGIVNSSSPH